uniref:2-alkenal reductase (NAD(P)(+)) n=4 Tax=Opuntia streptacantha TaxID=393608 RepID=A0A7C8YNH0_OPUST
MLNPLRKCLISLPKLAKTLVNQPKKVIMGCKRSKPKRFFLGFDGLKFGGLELSNQLELVFKFIDANGDGKISPLELSEFLVCLGHDKSKVKEEVQGMLKHMDSNGDGFIDLDEYMGAVMMDGNHDDHGHGHSDDDHHNHIHHHDLMCDGLEDDLMDAFLVFDCDKNGLISAKELQHVLKRLGFVNCSLKDCNYMIKGVDKDGDGYVNFDEFRQMMMGYVNVI